MVYRRIEIIHSIANMLGHDCAIAENDGERIGHIIANANKDFPNVFDFEGLVCIGPRFLEGIFFVLYDEWGEDRLNAITIIGGKRIEGRRLVFNETRKRAIEYKRDPEKFIAWAKEVCGDLDD
jgi:hypothetical protein